MQKFIWGDGSEIAVLGKLPECLAILVVALTCLLAATIETVTLEGNVLPWFTSTGCILFVVIRVLPPREGGVYLTRLFYDDCQQCRDLHFFSLLTQSCGESVAIPSSLEAFPLLPGLVAVDLEWRRRWEYVGAGRHLESGSIGLLHRFGTWDPTSDTM